MAASFFLQPFNEARQKPEPHGEKSCLMVSPWEPMLKPSTDTLFEKATTVTF